MFAPIILFTYRRIPDKTIESLLKNNLSKSNNLYIFSDGYKNEIDKQDVLKVRKYLKTIVGFKKVEVIEAPKNKGLANSIISGVTQIIKKYEKVIVLEDDVIVSQDFLEFMNEALNFYEFDENVWSISGYTPNIKLKNYKKDVYAYPRGTSWAWGTWKNRWDLIDWDIKDWESFKINKNAIKKFEKTGNDMFKMLELQILGKINSWAIRWTYNEFKYNKFTVYPIVSKAINIGFNDNKASNTDTKEWDRFKTILSDKKIKLEDIDLDEKIVKEVKKIYNVSIYTKIGYFLRKYGGYKLAKKILKVFQ